MDNLDVRNEFIGFRLTPQEHELFKSRAKALGLTKSKYARWIACLPIYTQLLLDNKSATKQSYVLIKAQDLSIITNNFMRIGVNINQIARALNILKKRFRKLPANSEIEYVIKTKLDQVYKKQIEVVSEQKKLFKEYLALKDEEKLFMEHYKKL